MATLNDLSEEDLLTACLWAEARGEIEGGQKAVCNVILNRVTKGMRPTIREVILQPHQFSWTAPGDVNLDKVFTASAKEPEAWGRANRIAKAALSGKLVDNTNNADHYLNIEATRAARGNGTLPSWYDAAKVTVVIGKHTFLNLLGA
jgi:spore germination cell wall hydrolase CwlJ-like protein